MEQLKAVCGGCGRPSPVKAQQGRIVMHCETCMTVWEQDEIDENTSEVMWSPDDEPRFVLEKGEAEDRHVLLKPGVYTVVCACQTRTSSKATSLHNAMYEFRNRGWVYIDNEWLCPAHGAIWSKEQYHLNAGLSTLPPFYSAECLRCQKRITASQCVEPEIAVDRFMKFEWTHLMTGWVCGECRGAEVAHG